MRRTLATGLRGRPCEAPCTEMRQRAVSRGPMTARMRMWAVRPALSAERVLALRAGPARLRAGLHHAAAQNHLSAVSGFERLDVWEAEDKRNRGRGTRA